MASKYSLGDYPILIELPILWGDMDAFQHVNNVQYFRYFESVRIAYFEAIGFSVSIAETNIGPILADTSCRYRFPLTYPDTIKVGARSTLTSDDTMTMDYIAWSTRADDAAALGRGTIVCLDYTANKRTPIPEAIAHKLKELEHKT